MALNINPSLRFFLGSQIHRLGFALQAGYRHIDTAGPYENEEEVGDAIKAFGIPRSEIFLTTKMLSESHTFDTASKEIDDYLKRLRVAYVDLYLIHEPVGGAKTRMAIWKALVDAKKASKVKNIGLCSNINHLEEIQKSGLELPVLNQIELHPLDQQRLVVQWREEHDIKLGAYCPLIRRNFDIPVLQELARKHKKNPAQVLVRWSLQKGYIPLPRTSKAERIRSNADVYDFNLSEAEMENLDKLDIGTDGAVSWNPIAAE